MGPSKFFNNPRQKMGRKMIFKCSKCRKIDKQSRAKQVFKCTSCGNTVHADLNAARNIARIGQERILEKRSLKSVKIPEKERRLLTV